MSDGISDELMLSPARSNFNDLESRHYNRCRLIEPIEVLAPEEPDIYR